jgi:hypothetical protein
MDDLQLRIEELEGALGELLRVYDVQVRREPSWNTYPSGAGAAWARAARVMPQQAAPGEQLYIQDKRTVAGLAPSVTPDDFKKLEEITQRTDEISERLKARLEALEELAKAK